MSERRQLEEQFSEEELRLAVKDCFILKASGPDGLGYYKGGCYAFLEGIPQ